jgi:hypothetical protein
MSANIPGRPIYTPAQLMAFGLLAAAGQFMILMLKSNKKGSQDQQKRGMNSTNQIEYVDKVVENEDGTTSVIKQPVKNIATDANEILSNPRNLGSIEFKEYQGPYHKYPNGACYTGASFTDESVQLIPYSTAIEAAERLDFLVTPNPSAEASSQTRGSEEGPEEPIRSPNNTIYFKLTGKRFDRHLAPKYYYPEVTEKHYESGVFERFFVQRINDMNDITEINATEFDAINNNNNPGPDQGLYRYATVQWSISGDVKEARKANLRVTLEADKEMQGLVNYLGDLDEFHPDASSKMNETRAEEYDDGEPIPPELPAAYNYPPDEVQGTQNCLNCRFRQENYCRRWNAVIRNEYWCKSWDGAVSDISLYRR